MASTWLDLVTYTTRVQNTINSSDLIDLIGIYACYYFKLYNNWQVTNEDLWPEVQERLKIPQSCTNADYGLRQMYIRWVKLRFGVWSFMLVYVLVSVFML